MYTPLRRRFFNVTTLEEDGPSLEETALERLQFETLATSASTRRSGASTLGTSLSLSLWI